MAGNKKYSPNLTVNQHKDAEHNSYINTEAARLNSNFVTSGKIR